MHPSNWLFPICNHEVHLANFVEQVSHSVLMVFALHQVEVLGVDHQIQWMMVET
jgi:hypothetical protein